MPVRDAMSGIAAEAVHGARAGAARRSVLDPRPARGRRRDGRSGPSCRVLWGSMWWPAKTAAASARWIWSTPPVCSPVSPGPPVTYRLRVRWPEAVQETEDPYSFGPLLGSLDLHLFRQGTHYELSRCLGAVAMAVEGVLGVRFAVWAPNARRVSVVGDFNSWDGRRHPMRLRREAGVWELFVPRTGPGDPLQIRDHRTRREPVAAEGRPCGPRLPRLHLERRRSSPAPIPYDWTDGDWKVKRASRQAIDAPLSVYEVHAGSWFRVRDEGNRSLTWRELADRAGALCRGTRLHAHSSSCPSWSIRSVDPGATSPWGSSHPRAVTGRRKISPISSTAATRAVSA